MAYGNTTTQTPFGGMQGRRTADTTPISGACNRSDLGIGSPQDNYDCDNERSAGPLPCEENCGVVLTQEFFDVHDEPTGPQGPWFRRTFTAECKDCDNDGISDTCAIEYGISVDSDPRNGIPDECE